MTIVKKSFSELSGELAAISAAHAASHPGFAEATARAQAAKVARDRAEEAYANCPTPAAAEVRAAAFDEYEACLSAARTAYINGWGSTHFRPVANSATVDHPQNATPRGA